MLLYAVTVVTVEFEKRFDSSHVTLGKTADVYFSLSPGVEKSNIQSTEDFLQPSMSFKLNYDFYCH